MGPFETEQVIGQVHLDPYVNNYAIVPGDLPSPFFAIEVELAFASGKAFWGQGLAYEACQCLVKYVFKALKLPRLVGVAGLGNERSLNLQKRLGCQVLRAPQDIDGVGVSSDASKSIGWVTVLTNPEKPNSNSPNGPHPQSLHTSS